MRALFCLSRVEKARRMRPLSLNQMVFVAVELIRLGQLSGNKNVFGNVSQLFLMSRKAFACFGNRYANWDFCVVIIDTCRCGWKDGKINRMVQRTRVKLKYSGIFIWRIWVSFWVKLKTVERINSVVLIRKYDKNRCLCCRRLITATC